MHASRVGWYRAGAVLVLAAAVACSGASDSGRRPSASDRGDEAAPAPRAGVVAQPWHVDPPGSPAAVAQVLGRVERLLRDPGADPGGLRVAAWEQQAAYRVLRAHPEWAAPVVARVPEDVRGAVASNVAAGEALARLATDAPAPTTLPDWTIVAPAPAEVLLGYYRQAEARSGIPWVYLAAIHFVETRLGRIAGTSTAGAQGPMQFLPSTWEAYGEGDVNDDRDAILAAARYLDDRGGPEEMDRALFAYNPSTDYVAAIQAYATVLLADERAYRGYYGWQVYYGTDAGVYLLPEGYPRRPAREIRG